jgi:RNA polymerase sigma-54 factor
LDLTQTPQVQTIISSRQIAAVRLLQLSSQQLADSIARERDQNPALEVEEHEWCLRCGAELDRPELPCPVCGLASAPQAEAHDDFDYEGGSSDFDSLDGGANGYVEDDGSDPMLRVAGMEGRAEGLLRTLCMVCAPDDAEIAEFVVGSLDSHGYLPANIIEDGADTLQCSAGRVARVVEALQRLDPPGIGARSAQECLLIQLRRLAEAGSPRPLAELLVRDFLKKLAFRHFRDVAHAIGETPKVVEAEWEFIRAHLNPYPAHGFDPDFNGLAGTVSAIRPDVIIRRREGGFEAEVVEARRYHLQVSRDYRRVRTEAAALGVTERERSHVREYLDRTQSFISALRQRWETMQRVSDALIELQREFLERGPSGLKPLTRADVARLVELHESTVSRATDGKFVLLPDGRTVPFDDFFDSSLPIKKALRELIATENPRHPYSDEQLARLLRRRGMEVARRTIAKYREEIGILPSRLRRQRGTRPPMAPVGAGYGTAEAPVGAVLPFRSPGGGGSLTAS